MAHAEGGDMPVELGVLNHGSVRRVLRRLPLKLRRRLTPDSLVRSLQGKVLEDPPYMMQPHITVDSSTHEAAAMMVLAEGLGLGVVPGEDLTPEEYDDLAAQVFLDGRSMRFFNLFEFFERSILATSDSSLVSLAGPDESIVSIEPVLSDLEEFFRAKSYPDAVIGSASGSVAIGMLAWMLGALGWCVARGRLFYSIWRIQRWDGRTVITDRRIGEFGFDGFKRVAIEEDGRYLMVTYLGGARYRIPCEYLRGLVSGELPNGADAFRLQRARILRGREVFRAVFSDGRTADFLWEDILVACEPMYEHYGGFHDAQRTFLAELNRRPTGFRVAPTPV